MPRKSQLPTHVPVNELAALSGQSARNIQSWAVKGLVPKPDSREGGYPLMSSMEAIRIILEKRTDGAAAELAEYRRIQAKADSESAALDAAKKKRELVFQEDAEAIHRDYQVKVERVIQSAAYIARPLREKLGLALSKIKLEELPNAAGDKK
jgi:DNA-binding transcriptional MerR regulator